MQSLSKEKMVSFSTWAMLILMSLSLAGWKFGCQLMAMLFTN